jgi:hypothetical protein
MQALRSTSTTSTCTGRAARAAAPTPLRHRSLAAGRAYASGDASQFTIPEGATVRVTKPVRVFHPPKAPADGLSLEGMTGKVVKHAAVHKDGRVLSANLPYKVAFEMPPPAGSDKPVKFQAHLEESEIEVV